jgi:type IV pilus assembly protein PilQ
LAAASKEQLEPLVTKQIFINYATGEDLKPLIEPVLSKRGELKIDVRTNSILVTDTEPRVVQIEELAKSLDTRTPQVLIESRIVQATLDFTRQLGVQFGTNYRASAATGNPTGAFFPSSIQAGGVGTGSPGPFGSIGKNFIVDLPAAVGTGAGGALGIVLGSLTGAFDLDIRLSALENRGDGRILSSPRVLTINNHPARIEQGVSIPFLSVSAAGTQTQFVDATLRLEVKPQVTNDGRILMDIKVTDNAPDTSVVGANGQPAIRRNEAESQVLATDGETIVIGGIFTRTTTENIAGIPWFSRIPLLGWLFRNTQNIDQRRELLVFITPRIVK